MADDPRLVSLRGMNREHEQITGSAAYLYCTQPAGTPYYVFADDKKLPLDKAYAHMMTLLDRARAGQTPSWSS